MASSTATKKRTAVGATAEVPIFLQKAYHMIDTCDPSICSWSEDGLTFIVKDTSLFETTIIPQFFKHNKFSSFVRQLNFYGFRKVKFSNSLKIDHKLEAQTAKFWRFRHDKFRRGRKDLLTEIKRTPSAASASAGIVSVKAAVPRPFVPLVRKETNEPSSDEVARLKTEMEAMKRRMASMTKNIDELTDLVKKVRVDDDGEGAATAFPGQPRATESVEVNLGNKRKKTEDVRIDRVQPEDEVVDDLLIMPDWIPSSSDFDGVDSMLLGDQPLPDFAGSGGLTPPTAPSPVLSDDAFVDDLFQAFADEDATIPGMESANGNEKAESIRTKPCPRLMTRIEDSLSTIPRDMQEIVCNRFLVNSIADAQPIPQEVSSLFLSQGSVASDLSVPSDASVDVRSPCTALSEDIPAAEDASKRAALAASIPLPLAVATLKTILSEYGVVVECRRSPCKDASMHASRFAKSLPVVPLHA